MWVLLCRHIVSGIFVVNTGFSISVQIDADGIIWVMTNGLPVYNYARLNPSEYNYRIWTRSAADAIRNTVCDVDLSTRLILNWNLWRLVVVRDFIILWIRKKCGQEACGQLIICVLTTIFFI